jgi:NADPH:quinone reductase-like Zn-dependent oxidoreductase
VARLVTGLRRPRHRILGSELAGVVEAAGPAVTEFSVGDAVFGVKAWTFGAHAEFVCMREGAALAHKPAGASFTEAAAVCDGVILALMGLRRADIRTGRSILVYGASGSIGTAAVQLSRHFGADVTAVCSTKNLELVANLGADHVIDYTQQDFTRTVRPTTSSSTPSASSRSGAAVTRSVRAGSTWPPISCSTWSWPSGPGSGARR